MPIVSGANSSPSTAAVVAGAGVHGIKGSFAFGALLNSCVEAAEAIPGGENAGIPKASLSPRVHAADTKFLRFGIGGISGEPGSDAAKRVDKQEPQDPTQPTDTSSKTPNPAITIQVPEAPGLQTASATHKPLASGVPSLPVASNPGQNASSLAFAMRVAVNGDGQTQPPTVADSDGAGSSFPAATSVIRSETLVQAVAAPAQEQRQRDLSEGGAQGFLADGQASMQRQPNALKAQEAHSSPRNNFEVELKQSTTPVRGAHVQVVGSENQRVDIRLLEGGGELSISVKSSDSTLARALQDNIPELTNRLESQHFHTEAWAPAGTAAATGGGAKQDGSPSSGSNSYGGSAGQQQNGRDGDKPRWVEELEQTENTSTDKEIFYVSSQ